MYTDQPTQPIQQQRRRGGCFGCFGRLMFGTILLLAGLIFTGAVVTATLVYSQLATEIEEGIARLDAARERETFETTVITDRNGQVLWEIFGEGKRTTVALSAIPLELQQATIATEDDSFYENIGLDAPSLIAALIADLRNPTDRPAGGSTITQQLVRHIAFDYEERTQVSYRRKAKEIILAWMMNKRYSKEEVLALYLNEIYYGNLAYGIEAAAQTYFGKPAGQLTLAESSLLAALPQSPVDLDPFTNLDRAKERQWLVLNLMVSEGYITQEQAVAAYQAPLAFAAQEVSLVAPHFAVYVRQLLEAQFGADVVANGGLRITTTLDLDYQRLAENLARQHVDSVGPDHNLTNAALVALKPGTGEILAMLGSVDYHNEAIDGRVNITLSPQQPGSSIKPLTYAAALSPTADGQIGWTAADVVWDVPVTYPQLDGGSYSPLNYDRTFHGPLRLRSALANSYNVPAVLVLQDIGVARLLEFGQQLGIESWAGDPGRYGLSLTLGGGEVTPLELTAAYAVFANGGNRIPPTAILSVTKSDGTLLYQYQPPPAQPVLDSRVAFLISNILDDDTARLPAMGRNNPLALPFPVAAKTGTTNDFRDNWTMGYTPGLVVGVWTGNTDNSEMVNISGLTGAAPLWSDFMKAVYSNYDLLDRLLVNGVAPAGEFVAPAGVEQRPICTLSTITIGATDCNRGDREWFLTNEPSQPPTLPPAEPLVVWQKIDPAVWQLPAVPLPPLPPELVANTGNDFPPPTACYIAEGVAMAQLPANVVVGLYLAPPRNEESQKAAYQWAANHNLPILPRQTCTEELLAQSGRGENELAIWFISSPTPNQIVTRTVPIIGTADFDPVQIQFYKVEIGAGPEPQEWITLGEIHSTPVINGQLEGLAAPAFPAGIYTLRLVIILWDGNEAGPPHRVTFTISQ